MGLQVRALGVRFPAARERAGVRRGPLPRPGAATPLGLRVEQLQRGGRRGEHHPLAARLHALQTLVVHTERVLLVRQMHLRGCRGVVRVRVLVRVRRRGVILVRVALQGGVAHWRLALRASLLAGGAERRRHAVGGARGDGDARLLEGQHARHVPLLLDLGAALRRHAHDGTVAVHVGLHFDVVHNVLMVSGELRHVTVKPALPRRRAVAVLPVGGPQQLGHEAGGVRRRRRAALAGRVGRHGEPGGRVQVGVGRGAHIFRTCRCAAAEGCRTACARCVGENKIQIQVVAQILVVLSAPGVRALHHLEHGAERLVRLYFPSLEEEK